MADVALTRSHRGLVVFVYAAYGRSHEAHRRCSKALRRRRPASEPTPSPAAGKCLRAGSVERMAHFVDTRP